MIKTIKIGERDVRFDTSLAWMFKYRTQFGHDPIDVIMPAVIESCISSKKFKALSKKLKMAVPKELK